MLISFRHIHLNQEEDNTFNVSTHHLNTLVNVYMNFWLVTTFRQVGTGVTKDWKSWGMLKKPLKHSKGKEVHQ